MTGLGALVKRLSRHPFKVKATGSNPVRPTLQYPPSFEEGGFFVPASLRNDGA